MENDYRPFVVVGGGFDPLHEGHLNYFKGAARFGRLVVVVNSDKWLMRKKGRVFMPQAQRVRLIENLKMVHRVYVLPLHPATELPSFPNNDYEPGSMVNDNDDTVSDFLYWFNQWGPGTTNGMAYAKSGDRTTANTPEWDTCVELGIPMIFNVCKYNGVHSSDLLKGWESGRHIPTA